MSKVKITASEYTKSSRIAAKALSIELSPYDIPLEVKGHFDQETGLFHIDFEYSDKEESQSKQYDKKLNIKVGKHSGKILGFEIKVVKHDIGELMLTIQTAVDQSLPQLEKFNEQENYKLVRSLVERHKEPIFADLA